MRHGGAAAAARIDRSASAAVVGTSARRLEAVCPVVCGGELVGDVGRRMIGDPAPEAGMLAVGGGEVVG